MTYPLLKYGNKIPAVGVAQKLLNARAGDLLKVDGIFGGGLDTFKFEGPTHTSVPFGHTLKSWSSSRPDFIGMSVI